MKKILFSSVILASFFGCQNARISAPLDAVTIVNRTAIDYSEERCVVTNSQYDNYLVQWDMVEQRYSVPYLGNSYQIRVVLFNEFSDKVADTIYTVPSYSEVNSWRSIEFSLCIDSTFSVRTDIFGI